MELQSYDRIPTPGRLLPEILARKPNPLTAAYSHDCLPPYFHPFTSLLRLLAIARSLPRQTPHAREVRLALCDDFDTPRAVRHLAALCTLVSNHLNDLKGVDLAPAVSAANYAAETLALLGVGSSTGGARLRVGTGRVGLGAAELASAVEALPPTREVIAAMVEFRRLVRKHVLERNLSKNPANGKLMKRWVTRTFVCRHR